MIPAGLTPELCERLAQFVAKHGPILVPPVEEFPEDGVPTYDEGWEWTPLPRGDDHEPTGLPSR